MVVYPPLTPGSSRENDLHVALMRSQPRWVILLACCVVATSVSTHAADSTEASAESALESAVEKEVGELLIASPPAGWTLDFATNAPDLRIAEYSRDDEDSELWTQKIKFESLAGHLLPEPVEFFRSFAENQKKTCPELEDYGTFSGFENGYPTSVHLFVCRRNALSNISLVTMIKAIKGNDFFYAVTRAQRAEPLEASAPALAGEEIGGWSIYMKSIVVCDTEKPDHPCP